MSSEKKKVINVQEEVVAKESEELRKVEHKATAGLSEQDAIAKHVVAELEEDEEEEKDVE